MSRDLITGERPMPDTLDFDPALVAAIQRGIEIERMMHDPVGVMLWNRAMAELEEAMDIMMTSADPASAEFRAAHDQARIARKFIAYINDGLQEAEKAREQLENDNGEEELEEHPVI